jgi:hypothetical protein
MTMIRSPHPKIRYRVLESVSELGFPAGCPITGHPHGPKIVGPPWHAPHMTEHTIPTTFGPRLSGERSDPAPLGDERQALTESLEYYRRTFELKCTDLDPGQLSERSVPPSTLTLHGLLRHLTGCERWWFRIQFAGEAVPNLYYSDDDPDQDFTALDGDVGEAFSLWHKECERSREIVAASPLERTGTRLSTGEPFTLRWLMLRMIGEYARHIGQADLIRERIDGATGE